MGQWTSELSNFNDSLPTLYRWMKTVSAECASATRLVKMIWKPNQYLSYSLDTEAYRVRFAEEHPLYQVLEDYLDTWIEQDVVIALSVEGGKKPVITLVTLDTEQCEWSELGDFGYKAGAVSAKKSVSSKTRKAKAPTPELPILPLEGSASPVE